MRLTIDLDRESERVLDAWVPEASSRDREALLTELFNGWLTALHHEARSSKAEGLVGIDFAELSRRLKGLSEAQPARSTPNVMGGDTCIRNTRIPIWTLVDYKRHHLTDSQILEAFPVLNSADLTAAWDYYASNAEKIDGERRRHEDAD